MSELDFALDGLYAAGWWPTQNDHCLQSPDQRWYPAPDAIRTEFTKQGADLIKRSEQSENHCTLAWHVSGHAWESVTTQTESAAYILAYTHLYQVAKREEPATIRH